MKVYGELVFDILYLIIITAIAIYILSSEKKKISILMGMSLLFLAFGDAFHLVPRILSNFLSFNFDGLLGIGKLITSITMTAFYLFLYYIYMNNYDVKRNKSLTIIVWVLFIARIVLCLMPQNRWLDNASVESWSIIRNIPFIILGILIIVLFFKKMKDDKYFKYLSFVITLSFAFYIPVILLASEHPKVGMLMIPKTICYIIISIIYLRKNNKLE